jgi:hypothetical protein
MMCRVTSPGGHGESCRHRCYRDANLALHPTFPAHAGRRRGVGFHILQGFVPCDVPSAVSVNLERCLPGALYRWIPRRLTYALGIVCVGRVRVTQRTCDRRDKVT